MQRPVSMMSECVFVADVLVLAGALGGGSGAALLVFFSAGALGGGGPGAGSSTR